MNEYELLARQFPQYEGNIRKLANGGTPIDELRELVGNTYVKDAYNSGDLDSPAFDEVRKSIEMGQPVWSSLEKFYNVHTGATSGASVIEGQKQRLNPFTMNDAFTKAREAAASKEAESPEAMDEWSFTRGLAQSGYNISSNLASFAGSIAKEVGFENVASLARDVQDWGKVGAARNKSFVNDIEDVKSAKDAMSYAAHAIGSSAGDLMLMLVPEAASSVIGAARLGKTINNIGKLISVAGKLATYGRMSGETIQQVEEETGENALGIGMMYGFANSMLERAFPESVLKSLTAAQKKALGKSMVAKVADLGKAGTKGAAKGFIQEGATEPAQEIVNLAAVKAVDENKEIFTPENLKNIREAAIKGGIGGAGFGSVGGAASRFSQVQGAKADTKISEDLKVGTETSIGKIVARDGDQWTFEKDGQQYTVMANEDRVRTVMAGFDEEFEGALTDEQAQEMFDQIADEMATEEAPEGSLNNLQGQELDGIMADEQAQSEAPDNVLTEQEGADLDGIIAEETTRRSEPVGSRLNVTDDQSQASQQGAIGGKLDTVDSDEEMTIGSGKGPAERRFDKWEKRKQGQDSQKSSDGPSLFQQLFGVDPRIPEIDQEALVNEVIDYSETIADDDKARSLIDQKVLELKNRYAKPKQKPSETKPLTVKQLIRQSTPEQIEAAIESGQIDGLSKKNQDRVLDRLSRLTGKPKSDLRFSPKAGDRKSSEGVPAEKKRPAPSAPMESEEAAGGFVPFKVTRNPDEEKADTKYADTSWAELRKEVMRRGLKPETGKWSKATVLEAAVNDDAKKSEVSSDVEDLFNSQGQFNANQSSVDQFLLPQDENTSTGFDKTRMQPKEAGSMDLGAILDEDGAKTTEGQKTAKEISQSKQAQKDTKGGEELRKESLRQLKEQGTAIKITGTESMPIASIEVDPKRFQYKMNVNKEGVRGDMKEVKAFEPSLAGVISVWKDPADGKFYVVNGHHRMELAKRKGEPDIRVQILKAKDAQEARMIGAIINMSEGNGNPIEAAKAVRDSGMGLEVFDKYSIPIKEGDSLGRKALALSKLSDYIFQSVVDGEISVAKAVNIGEMIADKKMQDEFFDNVSKRSGGIEAKTDRAFPKIINQFLASETTTEVQFDIFGGEVENARSIFVEKGEIVDATESRIRDGLSALKATQTQRTAKKMEAVGKNKIDAEANRKEIAQRTRMLDDLDRESSIVGSEINKILNSKAQEILDQTTVKGKRDAMNSAVDEVLNALNGGDVRFSKYTGGDRQFSTEIETIQAMFKAMENLGKDRINVKFARVGKGENSLGWFKRSTGEVFINMDMATAKDIEKLLVHEDFVHGALKEILGEQGYKELFEQVRAEILKDGSAFSGFAKDLAKSYKESGVDLKDDALIDEVLANWYQEVYRRPQKTEAYDSLGRKVVRWFHKTFGKEGKEVKVKSIQDKMDEAFGKYLDQKVSPTVKMSPRQQHGVAFSKVTGIKTKLYAVHNTKAEGIIFSDEIGGIPAPSMAISKDGIPFTNFGSITLVGDSSLVDGSRNEVAVFDADVYSARQPEPDYKISKKGLSDLQKELDDDLKSFGDRGVYDVIFNTSTSSRARDQIDAFSRDRGVRLAYLKQQGRKVNVKMVPERLSDPELRKSKEMMSLAKQLPDERPSFSDEKFFVDLAKKYYDYKLDFWKKAYVGMGESETSAIELAKQETTKEKGYISDPPFGKLDRLLNDLYKIKNNKKEIDPNLFDIVSRNSKTFDRPEYKKWVAERMRKIFIDPTIKVGGKKVPYTADAAAREMTGAGVRGKENFKSEGAIRAMVAKSLRTIDDIRGSSDKIVDSAVMDAYKDASSERFSELLEKLGEFYEYDGWGAYDDAHDAISAIGKGKLAGSALRQHGFKGVPDELVREIKAYLGELKMAPTQYFEAKVKRAVDLGEFKAALVPSDEMQGDHIGILERNGVSIYKYNPKSEKSWIAAMRKAHRENDVMFSKATALTNTENFKKWFGNSAVVDENGDPLVVYHGSGTDITEFDPSFTGKGNDQLGSGFYFTTDKDEAKGYQSMVTWGKEKLGGNDRPTTIEAFVSLKNPIMLKGANFQDADISLSKSQASKIIAMAPDIMDPEDSPLGDWIDSYWEEGAQGWMIDKVAENYTGNSIFSLENDFFRRDAGRFRDAINKVLGYDGVIQEFEGKKHVVAWFPTQIKSATGNVGTFDPSDPDIRYSKKITLKAKPPADPFDENPTFLIDMEDAKEAGRIYDNFKKAMGDYANKLAKELSNKSFATIPDEDGRFAIVAPSVRQEEGDWQLTRIDRMGPSGHTTYKTHEAAVKGVVKDRYPMTEVMVRDDAGPDGDRRFSKLLSPNLASKIGGRDNSYMSLKSRGVPFWERMAIMARDALKVLRQGALDRFAPLMDLDSSGYVYRLSRLAQGTATAINAFLDHGAISWIGESPTVRESKKGFVSLMKQIGEEGMERYLFYRMGKREQDLRRKKPNYVPSYTPEEVRELVAMADGINFPDGMDLAKLDAEFNRLNDSVLDFAVEAGLLHADIKDRFQESFYIPFYRVMDDEESGNIFSATAKRAGQNIDNYIKKIEGGEAMINDPLENVIKNWSTLIDQAVKNRARDAAIQRMMDLGLAVQLVQEPNDGKEQVLEEGREYFNFTNLTDKRKERIVSHIENGVRRHYRIKDEMMLAALTVTKPQMLDNWVMKALKFPKRALTYGATFGMAFKVANVIRDATSVALTHKDFNAFTDTFKGMIGAFRQDQDYIEMMAAMGGFETGYVNEADAAKTADVIRKRLRKRGVLSTIGDLFRFWDNVGGALENATRLGLYKRKKASGDITRAAFDARDVLDFHLTGAADSVKVLTAITPFLNARLQGLYKLGRAGKENPKHIAAGLAIVGAATMLLWQFRDEEEWEKLEDWDKWTYWHFWIGGQHFRIPKPFELSVVPNAVELAMDQLNGTEDFAKTGKFLAHTMRETFQLVDYPAAIKPVVEQWANKSMFTGRAIVPMYLEGLEAGAQAKPWTGDTLKLAGEYIGVSPLRAEALLRGYGSTVAETILMTTDAIFRSVDSLSGGELNTVTRPAMGKSDIPLTGRFIRSDVQRNTKYGTEYYEIRDEVGSLYNTVRHYAKLGNLEQARELAESNKWKLKVKKIADVHDRALGLLRKKSKAIYLSKELSPQEKKRQLEDISKRQTEIQRRFYDMYLKLKKANQ